MATDHRVRAGECLASIGYDHGLPVDKIWQHPNNAELRKRRANPNVLKEGDVVHLPDVEPKTFRVATGTEHRFVVKRPATLLRLRIVLDPGPPPATDTPPAAPPKDRRSAVGEDPAPASPERADQAQAGVAYTLELDGGRSITGTTDSGGMIECPIPANAKGARLILQPGTPHETAVALNLGHLDPIEEVSGVKQRLANLCFDCGDTSDELTPGLEAALRAFQEKQGLPITGQVDDCTRDALKTAHDQA